MAGPLQQRWPGTSGVRRSPHDSQFKCYDGMHNWNQLQPAPYDGMYSFPSVTAHRSRRPASRPAPTARSASRTRRPPRTAPIPTTILTAQARPCCRPASMSSKWSCPRAIELVKEEDKNILIGDNFIAPVTQQFGGLGSIFILPDQAEVAASSNPNNPQNHNTGSGPHQRFPATKVTRAAWKPSGPASVRSASFPISSASSRGSAEVAPFAGATRHLCDRKEVTLTDQTSALAKFYIFTETHTASHFTGVITDDFTAEFDPFSPQFGEKFGPAYLPVSFKDWAGNEIERVYYRCVGRLQRPELLHVGSQSAEPDRVRPHHDGRLHERRRTDPDGNGGTMTDPLFQDGYSQFCYELPFMPGQTGYFDTPVVPTSAFAGGYNNPDCAYPDATPAISEVDGDGIGPWVATAGGAIQTVAVTAGGSGYTSAPTVSISGAPGTGAAATAVISGKVNTVTLTTATKTTNRGYSSAPTVGLTGGGGSGATAIANMTGSVTSVTVTTKGVYQGNVLFAPTVTVTITGTGTGATATANMTKINPPLGTTWQVNSVTITNAGTGYTGSATVAFSTGTTRALGTVQLGQSVASVNVTNGGSGYTSLPSVTFTGSLATGGQAAAATSTISGSVVAVNVASGGSGYVNPTVGFSGGGGGGAGAPGS